VKFTFLEPYIFVKLFECIARFANKVHLDIDDGGVRVRSVDPSDFCYVDVFLTKSFFAAYEACSKYGFGIDISRFPRFLASLASANSLSMIIEEEGFVLEATKNWVMRFKVNFLEEDPYDLPEPKEFHFDASVEIPSSEFSKLVNSASTISNELNFSIQGDHFILSSSSGDYSYSGELSSDIKIHKNGSHNVSAFAIAGYIKALAELINKCEIVSLSLGNDKPIRLDLKYLDKAVFAFLLSNRRFQSHSIKVSGRDGTSLPRLTVTRLPEFLLYLSNCPDGEDSRFLREAGFETSGGDYSRMTQQLNLAERAKGKIRLAKQGEIFVNLMQNDPERAKHYLNGLALSHIESYRVLMESLNERPFTPNELHEEINKKLSEKSGKSIDKQDLSTLLGLAIWCGVLDRKLALYYLKKGERT
jgi:hypothetical protein